MVSHQIRPISHRDVTIPYNCMNCKLIKCQSRDGQTRNEPGKAGVALYSPTLSLTEKMNHLLIRKGF